MANRSELFAPLTIRGLTVPNRFVMSPMNRNAAPGGVPGEDIAQFYRRRAAGDVGLIVTGGIGIDHPAALGVSSNRECNVPTFDGAARAAWAHVVAAVHAAGGKIAAQLWHQGPMRSEGTGYHPEAPSCRPSGIWGPIGRRTEIPADYVARFAEPTTPPSDAEIVAIVEAYGRTARVVAELGFDAVEIHGSNGYAIDAFLWGETNRRTDRWGGTQRERTRFAVEVVKAVRAGVGETLPVFFRFSQWKHQDVDARPAQTPEQLADIVAPIAAAGVDVLDASEFDFDVPEFAGSPLNLAGWTKKLTGSLTMTVGSVGISRGLYDESLGPAASRDNVDALAERFARGEFDLVAVGRSLLADPAWVRNVRLGLPVEPYSDAVLRAVS